MFILHNLFFIFVIFYNFNQLYVCKIKYKIQCYKNINITINNKYYYMYNHTVL